MEIYYHRDEYASKEDKKIGSSIVVRVENTQKCRFVRDKDSPN